MFHTSVFKTTTVFFSVLPSSFSVSVIELSKKNLLISEAVATTQTMTLDYNTTNHKIFCYSVGHVPCLML